MKKLFFTLLTLCLCGATWAYDFSADNTEGTTIYYNYVYDTEGTNVTGVEVTYGNTTHYTSTYSGTLTIPDTVENDGTTYNVVGVGEYGAYNASITSVSFGQNVTYIGKEAFDSSSLTSVTIPNTVETIGEEAFEYCHSLATVTITGSGSTTIGDKAFANCYELTSVEIGDGVTSIGDEAFDSCESLTTVSIGSGVAYIGSGAFGDCAITSFTIADGNEYYTIEDGILYDSAKTTLLQDLYYSGSDYTVPESVTTIGEEAFAKSSIETLTLGSNVSSIGGYAFWDCESLTTINCLNPVPPTCATNAFLADSNVAVYVPAGTIDYYNEQWSGVSNENIAELTYAVIKITTAEGYATYYNADYDVTMPEGVTAYTVSGIEVDEEDSSSFSITLNSVSGNVPAGTAVVIEGTAQSYLNVTATSSSSTGTEGNMLYGSSTTGTTTGPDEGVEYYFYKLSHNANGDYGSMGFYWDNNDGSAFTIPANKAWLAVPTSEFDSVSPTAFSFKKDDSDTTGISAVESASEKTVSGIYTIQGVRVSNMNQPGLYIVDGKKVLVK